jgi:nitroimidazol reductase NimA-like FMN-containing flavoprotein (pyridoxamine 5'-phosphate oxidase superfamily)
VRARNPSIETSPATSVSDTHEEMTEIEPESELDARFSQPDAVPTPWSQVRDVIESSELFWISTVRATGAPHVTPLPAVWRDGALYFCTGPSEQKAVNLASNDECVLTTGTNRWKEGLDVVVEGRARWVTDEPLLRELAAAWEEKYRGEWRFDVRDGAFHHDDGGEAHVFEVRPRKVLAFAEGEFAQTRFRFPAGDRPPRQR